MLRVCVVSLVVLITVCGVLCFRYTPRLPALPIITETHRVTRPLKHRAAAFPAPSLCQVNTEQLPNTLRIP